MIMPNLDPHIKTRDGRSSAPHSPYLKTWGSSIQTKYKRLILILTQKLTLKGGDTVLECGLKKIREVEVSESSKFSKSTAKGTDGW